MRIRYAAILCTAALVGLGAPQVSATPVRSVDGDPIAALTVDDETFVIPLTRSGVGWLIGDSANGWTHETSEFQVQLSGFLDPDPSIAYGLGIVDFGAPSVFGFLFGTPIVPVVSPNVVNGSLAGSLTDATGDGVSITPSGALVQSAAVSFPATNMGVDVGPGAAFGPGAAGAVHAYGPHSAGPLAGPGPGPWTFLTVSSAFALSGGGDSAALTGFASIEEAGESPVPEPATVALFATGIAALRLRRRAQS